MEPRRAVPSMEEVYDQYFSVVYNYVYYKLLNRENTEDIVSQVFMKAMQHLDRFDPAKASMKTWLMRIAEHAVIDFYRRQKPQISYSQEENGLENMLHVDFEEEYNRILSPERKMVLDALRELPQRERMFIYYKYFLGITNREIAMRLGMNENTVSAIIARTRKKLKALLADEI